MSNTSTMTTYFNSENEISKEQYESLKENSNSIGVLQQGEVSCPVTVNFCCRIEIPPGFNRDSTNFPEGFGFQFDLSNIRCYKEPLLATASVPTCVGGEPLECEVVAGYAVRVCGSSTLLVNAPLFAIEPGFFNDQLPARGCCSSQTPVDDIIAYTCNPAPCTQDCVTDITGGFVSWSAVSDECGEYILVVSEITLAYAGCTTD
ncbi:hypothetical protein M3172_25310 [Mesobacillus subterraneus]|uniref:hypothetical protein n=1 Tax=Mesobacillus subterraneus TaxID=285983 RepID=UPI00203C5D71|nr:hypothetical protein [Mesobacillus subterraneus]MCM3576468.1 hypothetical protein [Mesobacillus subterraneus]